MRWTLAVPALCVAVLAVGCAEEQDTAEDRAAQDQVIEEVGDASQPESPRQWFRRAIQDVSPGKGVRRVTITKSGKRYLVEVRFDASDNLSTGLRKRGIERDMQEIYRKVFTGPYGRKITEVLVFAYFPLVDEFGDESAGIVYGTALAGSVAKRIN